MELILVLAIVTIVVAIVAPSLRGFAQGRTCKNTATLMLAMTSYARTQAVTEGRTYRLNFDPGGRSFWLTFENGATYQSPGGDLGERHELADGVQMETDIAQQQDGLYVAFHPSGRTDPANIRLSDRYDDAVEIACSSATEMFRILPREEMTR